ncbi:histidine--tRNA ligase [Skermanella sp. TT6]|uniref:Histidine--tRNA ligase n=1 Tax=Skermanella cutis TaxID=2775420 RepID=A0ABX7B9V2_9PROT|nr:histidine--tRNA ligase [Skermanella sp. TT6]QQP90919.1 histidine--tRNA ligase [Skermanella sp. TT6]
MSLIQAKTPPGVMELLPKDQIAFQRFLDTIRRGYERFGFLPVETPVFETVDVLLTKTGGETEKQVYFVQSTGARQQGKDAELALRFDLTVPLARYVAEHEHDLAFPFRRYQMQRVYRGERAQKGRFREFYQCDIDVIGKDTLPVAYDAEMPAVIYHVFRELDVGGFTINFNNRKMLAGLFETFSIEDGERRKLALREIDKLDKIGRDKVIESLSGEGIGLDRELATRLLDAIGLTGTNAEIMAALGAMAGRSDLFAQGLAELDAVLAGLKALKVPEEFYRINPAIARGLDYYTGTVYETFLNDFPGVGSVCSGGRYDNLASHYTKSRLPGVGISIGATRLFYQLKEAGVIKGDGSTSAVLVTQLDPALSADYLAIAAELRDAGINTEVQFEASKIAKQLKYADRAGIRFAVLMGTDEQARGTVTLKDLGKGEQHDVPRAELAERVRGLIDGQR